MTEKYTTDQDIIFEIETTITEAMEEAGATALLEANVWDGTPPTVLAFVAYRAMECVRRAAAAGSA